VVPFSDADRALLHDAADVLLRAAPALDDDATRGRLGYLAGWLDGLAGRLPALHEQPAGRRSLEG
jgi:hypothetical protein